MSEVTLKRLGTKQLQVHAQSLQALDWISTILEKKFPLDDLAKTCQDGVVLCQLLRKLDPTFVKNPVETKVQFKQMQNVQFFIDGCKQYGVQPLFACADVPKMQNLEGLTGTLHALSVLAKKKGFAKGIEDSTQLPVPMVKENAGTAIKPIENKSFEYLKEEVSFRKNKQVRTKNARSKTAPVAVMGLLESSDEDMNERIARSLKPAVQEPEKTPEIEKKNENTNENEEVKEKVKVNETENGKVNETENGKVNETESGKLNETENRTVNEKENELENGRVISGNEREEEIKLQQEKNPVDQSLETQPAQREKPRILERTESAPVSAETFSAEKTQKERKEKKDKKDKKDKKNRRSLKTSSLVLDLEQFSNKIRELELSVEKLEKQTQDQEKEINLLKEEKEQINKERGDFEQETKLLKEKFESLEKENQLRSSESTPTSPEIQLIVSDEPQPRKKEKKEKKSKKEDSTATIPTPTQDRKPRKTASQLEIATSHSFKSTTFMGPTYCDHCNDFLWGVYKQGKECKECKMPVHDRCATSVIISCDVYKSKSKNTRPPLDNIPTGPPPKPENFKDNRGATMWELLVTEESYVKDLNLAIDMWLKPLQNTNILPPESMTFIFGDLENLLEVNTGILEAIQKETETGDSDDWKFGNIFSQIASDLKIYTTYVNNFDLANNELKTIKAKDVGLQTYLGCVTEENKKVLKGLDLEDFLIKPVQRILKYPLFAREMLKVTPESLPDHELLKKSIQELDSLGKWINELSPTPVLNSSQKRASLPKSATSSSALLTSASLKRKSSENKSEKTGLLDVTRQRSWSKKTASLSKGDLEVSSENSETDSSRRRSWTRSNSTTLKDLEEKYNSIPESPTIEKSPATNSKQRNWTRAKTNTGISASQSPTAPPRSWNNSMSSTNSQGMKKLIEEKYKKTPVEELDRSVLEEKYKKKRDKLAIEREKTRRLETELEKFRKKKKGFF